MKYKIFLLFLPVFLFQAQAKGQEFLADHQVPMTSYQQSLSVCKSVYDDIELFETGEHTKKLWKDFSIVVAHKVGKLERCVQEIVGQHVDNNCLLLDDVQYLMDVVYEICLNYKKIISNRAGSKIGYTKVALSNIRNHLMYILEEGYATVLELY